MEFAFARRSLAGALGGMRTPVRSPANIVALGLLLFSLSVARADVGDLLAIITHVPTQPTILRTTLLLALVMLLNYFVNVIVVAVPVSFLAGMPLVSLLRPIVLLTLLGQAADRIGFFASMLVIVPLTGSPPSPPWLVLAIMFLICGLTVALVVAWFLRWRCSLTVRHVFGVAFIAGILTNPMWGLMALGLVSA